MEMNVPVGSTALDVGAQRVVGKPLDRVDGRLKVTGGALYAHEFEQGPKTAYGVLVEASIGKGRIKSIDTDSAERAPGVILVLTYRNAPEQGTGNHHVAHPVLTSPEVLYYGLPVAFVVAETFEEATAAAYLVRVNYDGAPGRYTLRSGLGEARIPQEGPPPDSAVGDFAAAFATAPVQLDVTYTTPLQSHAMMEPHATLAVWEGDNLILHTSNQMLNQGRDAVARTLEIPVENVRLVSPFIGGGFGAKLWVNADAILAAIAARQLDRPVKTALTRQQVFQVTTHRSDTIQRIRLGTDRNGRILAIGHDVFSGNLWSEQNYEGAALQTRTLYAGDNRLTIVWRLWTFLSLRRCAPPERRSVCWLWNAPWTSSPRSWTSTRSSCGCATSRRRIRKSTSPIQAVTSFAALRRERAALGGTGGIQSQASRRTGVGS
jgi:xanthine dehydrogenase YagR molybdenum-binding subunit